MVVITFPTREEKRRAVGFLAGRFWARLFRSGEVIVPEAALEALAAENFTFTVVGKPTYDQMAPFRGAAPAPTK